MGKRLQDMLVLAFGFGKFLLYLAASAAVYYFEKWVRRRKV